MSERPQSLIKKTDGTLPKAKKMTDAAKEAVLNIYLFNKAEALETKFYRNTIWDMTTPILNILRSNLLIDDISGLAKKCTLTDIGVRYVETNFPEEVERELGYMHWDKAKVALVLKEREILYEEIKTLTGRESKIAWHESLNDPSRNGWEINVFLPCGSEIEIDHMKGEYTLDVKWCSQVDLETWSEIDSIVRKMLPYMQTLTTRMEFPPVEDFLPKKEETE